MEPDPLLLLPDPLLTPGEQVPPAPAPARPAGRGPRAEPMGGPGAPAAAARGGDERARPGGGGGSDSVSRQQQLLPRPAPAPQSSEGLEEGGGLGSPEPPGGRLSPAPLWSPAPGCRPPPSAQDPGCGPRPGGDMDPLPPRAACQPEQAPGEPPACPEEGPRLRAVFDALDRDGDGFVRIEEFVQFATVYGAEQVKDLTKYLDPSGLGVISFEDFYRGITAIRNGDPDNQLYDMGYAQEEDPPTCPDEFDDFVTFEANEVTDSAYMGSESTYSECETFTDEDTSTLVHHEMHDEVETDSAIDSTVHSEFTDAIEEPENGPNKRLSSKKVARHLHQTGTLAVDATEDPYRDAMECADEDITDKVIFLEKRVTELEKDTAANGEQHNRLKQENLQLVHRANALEEQLKEQELKADETLMEEIKKQREILSKMEREKSIEIENLQARLQQLDDDNSELRSCVPCLKASIERLEEEKQKLLDEIEDLTAQLKEEQESKRKMGDKLTHERHQFQKEKESTQELIEDLRKQLEHLQLFKLEAEQRRGRSSSMGLQEYNSRTRETELEQEIRRLKQDNRNLKEQNDELNGQIINLSIQGAKNLFSASFSESLAAEISSVSRDELMEAIQKQEEINFRLQDYIDRIIVAIMETNPSILEVK
ncbi:rab11 family-interacting protein 3 isoform X3 [Alligator mississippiensis]|uniref:rab11 family-interacting protein 3 isoform X3 n=1 Tax=Alligator mississippiensis TaxID=8496 RepID=UPI002877960D|nr:rab11 family-interacting protein 3 isoform X3 [Alligator mississippiensis]